MQSVNICTDIIESDERQCLCCSAVALRPHSSCPSVEAGFECLVRIRGFVWFDSNVPLKKEPLALKSQIHTLAWGPNEQMSGLSGEVKLLELLSISAARKGFGFSSASSLLVQSFNLTWKHGDCRIETYSALLLWLLVNVLTLLFDVVSFLLLPLFHWPSVTTQHQCHTGED